MLRIDTYPTHEFNGFKLRAGKPLPFGASIIPGGVNFAIFSREARSCELVLFKKGEKEPFAIIPFLDGFRIGNVFNMIVFDLNYEEIEYGFRMDGEFDIKKGLWFNQEKILLDPYAKSIGGREVWGENIDKNNIYQHRARIMYDDFDWENDRPLEIPMENLIIYEMHVRGFTVHSSSNVKHRGTFAGIREKIPHLKELGVNCVELLPIFEFDEFENERINEKTGQRLMNYWGYSNVGFFAPKAGYAASGRYGMEADELKKTIKDLHKNGIEVILDVVFNHTAEGNEKGPYISFRGLDNRTYYMLNPNGDYYNFSGCGNTLNCNNPIVRSLILDCLRYWASEYHIDGFRFDLASILGRDQLGKPMSNPPLLETLAFDPILGKCKLIAEAWDADGLYQVGAFPSWGRWAEWNGKYRDDIRRFLKGDAGMLGNIVNRLQGSPDLYAWEKRGCKASINFITCHDGFTLNDLVTYNEKHNEANGEDNRDGSNDNHSWNCGFEGECNIEGVNQLRKKQIKNAITILMLSQGIPMIYCGDEMRNTQYGNNNAYCQDNEISWLDWNNLEKNREIFEYFKEMIKFRKYHNILMVKDHIHDKMHEKYDYPSVSWHGIKSWDVDFSEEARELGFMFAGYNEQTDSDEFIYVGMNMGWKRKLFEIPELPKNKHWYLFSDTSMKDGIDIYGLENEKKLENQNSIEIEGRTVVVILGK